MEAPFINEPMLGIVFAWETPWSLGVGVLEYSRLGCGGEGVRRAVAPERFWCCDRGDGAISRGSIFDMGGVDDGLLFRDGC